MKRYPYYCFRIVPLDGNFDKVENPLPVVLFDSLDKEVILGSEEVNYHWIAFAAEGKTIGMTMSHSIADGRSALWLQKTLLWCYLTEKYQIDLDPAGINLPDSAGYSVSQARSTWKHSKNSCRKTTLPAKWKARSRLPIRNVSWDKVRLPLKTADLRKK